MVVCTKHRFSFTSENSRERWDNVTCDHDIIAGATTCLNFWKWIKPSFTTPAASELYDFLISRASSTFTSTFNTYTRVTDIVHRCACARQMSTWKIVIIRANTSWARNTRSRTSQSFMYTSWSTEASELPHSWGKKRKTKKTKEAEQGERRHPQRRSLPICSILLSKWAIVRYALPKRQVCPSRCAVKEEFLSRVTDLYFVFGFHSHMIVNIFK